MSTSPKLSRRPSNEASPAPSDARASLRATEQHFRLLVDSVRDYAIFLLDVEGYVVSWNIGAERIKGYKASEILGHHFSAFYLEEDVQSGKCEMELELASREGRIEDEGWRVRKDGGRFWANVVITALRDETGQLVGFAKVTRDLTERRHAEEERIRLVKAQQAREASDAANLAKDQFIAHVSHELRTPLNAIVGWSRLLSSGLDADRAKRATATIERNAEIMARLIDDLLDLSRITSGKMRLELESVDVPLVIERAIETVKLSADAKEIGIRTYVDSSRSLIAADASRLQQVIWNLLSNAVKFTPRGGRIEVFLKRLDASVEIVVKDSGSGIAPDKLERVFEAFWQDPRGDLGGRRGLGLGLAICKTLVELHGGRIVAHSEGEGRGTTFTVTLPMTEARLVTSDLDDDQRTIALPRLEGLRVLVVEDESDAREFMRTVLEKCGCAVTAAENVPEALASFERRPPDVLVSDIGLPNENGYDLIRRIRSLPADRGGSVPAAAITAFARSEDRRRALAAGYLVHVPKPVDPGELAMVVAALASHVHPAHAHRTGRA